MILTCCPTWIFCNEVGNWPTSVCHHLAGTSVDPLPLERSRSQSGSWLVLEEVVFMMRLPPGFWGWVHHRRQQEQHPLSPSAMGHHLDTWIESQDNLKSKSTAADQSGSSKGQHDVRSWKYNPGTAFPSAHTAGWWPWWSPDCWIWAQIPKLSSTNRTTPPPPVHHWESHSPTKHLVDFVN